jgi:hypothetical protein
MKSWHPLTRCAALMQDMSLDITIVMNMSTTTTTMMTIPHHNHHRND